MERLNFETLKSHLWKSADILRGYIDAADYKNYIFGLLFLKRLSDVFDEEVEKIISDTGNNKVAYEDHDYHDFFVPKKAQWNYLKSLTQNIGEAINKANDLLEEENPESLEGVLSTVDFNDKDRLPDHILSQLINHFSMIGLGNADLEKPDVLGDAYEYLIAQFASSAGKKGGEFYTPKEVVELLIDILDPAEGMRICDPACGSGGMLIQSVYNLKEKKQNPRNISLYGQEINVGTWAICKMNLLLHGLQNAQIKRCDTLRDPQLLVKGKLMQFDIVIANPPFSLKNWGYEQAQNDPYKRFRFGVPPKGYADYAFVQHMISTINPTGKVGIVLPHGALFRGSAEGRIRKGIIEEDFLEAVIGLPPKLFYGTSIPACLFIVNKDKPKQRKGKVFFLYGANDYLDGKKQNKLRKQDIDKIVDAFREYKTVKKYCRPVTLDEIRENEYNLNITRYIDITEEEERIDIQKTIDELKKLKKEYQKVEVKVFDYLRELNYKV
ncbi:type I restriction-modification system subunit M [candidate division TA06 bacterium]|uniref:site-specific DNA-methyltransferase (adenine-specific) n=1 Tax=candidate division TA06 bacterium TaxID=2250710 RepID=A0A660SIH8_UNCT6|nr:MAG: type I restriction-modification system subunit M [candidate division TA06 bacterium]